MDTTHPISKGQRLAAIIGALALVVGLVLLGWGLAPAKGFGAAGDAFGGTPTKEQTEGITAGVEGAMEGLKARAWATGLGFVLGLGGFVALKSGVTRKEKTVEELMEERLQRLGQPAPSQADAVLERIDGDHAMAGSNSPSTPGAVPAPPAQPQPVPAPAPAPAAPAHGAPTAPAQKPAAPKAPSAGSPCPTCGEPLIAGGRFCRTCGRV